MQRTIGQFKEASPQIGYLPQETRTKSWFERKKTTHVSLLREHKTAYSPNRLESSLLRIDLGPNPLPGLNENDYTFG